MRLSIVIPVLNDEPHLKVLLAELQSLRQSGVEIIVVDGGSSDNSVSVAKPWVDRLECCSASRARQMNLGARGITTGYILFLHCDSKLPKNLIALVEVWEKQAIQWGFFRLRLDCLAWPYRMISAAINLRSGLTGVSTGDQCQFFHAHFFNEISGFDDIPLMEDVAISKRARRVIRAFREKSVVVTSARRWQKNGWLKTVLLMWAFRLAYCLGVSSRYLSTIYYPKADTTDG